MLRGGLLFILLAYISGCASPTIVDVKPSEASRGTSSTSSINLTNHPASDRNPAWSPDGMMIAFDSDRDGDWNIYVMGRLGQEVRRITMHSASDRAPQWSPDGSTLVFQSDRDGGFDLYTIELETGEIERLTDLSDEAMEPDWSPDGSRIAFISNHQLYILILGSRQVSSIALELQRIHGPAWSDDGRWLAFFARPNGHDDIVVLDLHDATFRVVTNDPGHQFAPCWMKSPNPMSGGVLIYASNTTASGRAELRYHGLKYGVDVWMTSDFGRATEPDNDRSGFNGIVFVSNRDGNDEIYRLH